MNRMKSMVSEARKAKGMTLWQVAEKSKVSQGYISLIELGHLRNKVSINVLNDVANALDIDKGKLALAAGHLPEGALEAVTGWMIDKGMSLTDLIKALEQYRK